MRPMNGPSTPRSASTLSPTRFREQYYLLFRAIAEPTSNNPAAWVSGDFGIGKTSFAKNVGLALHNPAVLGEQFAALFKRQIGDIRVAEIVDRINTQSPREVILFEVTQERDARNTANIAELMYAALLRQLDYAEDFDVAELEIELEAKGTLDQFIAKCEEVHNLDWRLVRKSALRVSLASAVLHALDPTAYATADAWAKYPSMRDASIDAKQVVERTFEIASRRRPGKALVFVIDEVTRDRIEDLQAIVEEFGRVGESLLRAKKIIAPAWIIVTSQQNLAVIGPNVEPSLLQARFRSVELPASDLDEVAAKRVLAKKADAVAILKQRFAENQGSLNAALSLEGTARRTEVTEDEFVSFYPYPPHYIDLCIGIMAGIGPQHHGGGNRTIIKQAYEMLVSDRTTMAAQPIGSLVTLDKVFDLIKGNLSSEQRVDICDVGQRFGGDPQDGGWALRVAKVICLLEFVRDLPRTEANIAACLVDLVGQAAPLAEVQAAVAKLQDAQIIRSTDAGWKLQIERNVKVNLVEQGLALAERILDQNPLRKEMRPNNFCN